MIAAGGLGIMAVCFGLGALASLLAWGSTRVATWVGHMGVLAGAIAGSVVASDCLRGSGAPARVELPEIFPFAQQSLSIDGLSAFFLLVVSLVAAAAAIYGPSYLRAHTHGAEPHQGRASAGVHVLALNVFVGSMAFLTCAGDALTFLLLWEGMTLASWVLVVLETKRDENVHAGLLYFVMAHVGTALLLFMFLSLTDRASTFEFDGLRAAARGLPESWRNALFYLGLGGFAAKAGVVPLHVWLPRAHPAAPSHVSALMSGVMLKVALYGMVRVTFDLLAPSHGGLPPAWGWTVLALGTVSALTGVLYALQQHDLKRLLAFSSVENVGIVLMAVGVAMLLTHGEGTAAPLATLALTAALLHVLNHAAFKSLLFLGAGAVLSRTHVRNMEQLGGLARRMPWTAWLFLLGAIAISALPPLNGFVSEWMTFQALLGAGAHLGGAPDLYCVLAASMLALTGGLAAACFVKAFGATFLGRPRSAAAEQATEAPGAMVCAMLLLGAVCLLLGVVPGLAIDLLDRPTAEMLGTPGASEVLLAEGPLILRRGGLDASSVATAISTTSVAALFAMLVVAAWLVVGPRRRAAQRLAPTWTCGMTPSDRFDYTATAFAKPLRLVFAVLYRPHRVIERETAGESYVPTRIRWAGEVVDLADATIYRRVQHLVTSGARFMVAHSTGRIHGYVAFVLVTLFVVLIVFGKA